MVTRFSTWQSRYGWNDCSQRTLGGAANVVFLKFFFFLLFAVVRSYWCCSHIRLANAFCGQPLLTFKMCVGYILRSCYTQT